MKAKITISGEFVDNPFDSEEKRFGEVLISRFLDKDFIELCDINAEEFKIFNDWIDHYYSRDPYSIERFFEDYAYLPSSFSGFINRLDTIHISYFDYISDDIGNILKKYMIEIANDIRYLEFLVIEKVWVKDSIYFNVIASEGKSLEMIKLGKY